MEIVLIPGWSNPPTWTWDFLDYFFTINGHRVIKTRYQSPRGWAAIETLAKEIRPAIESCENPILLAHSMGGLVSRHLLQGPEPLNHIKALITLGTPHFGAVKAKLAAFLSESAAQMVPGSPFLSTLNSQEWPDIRQISICARWENYISPKRNAKWKNSIILGDTTHSSLIFSPLIARFINEWLNI